MATDTTNYLLKKPTVGGDDDLWGGYINDNMDTIDTQMKSNDDAAAAAQSTADTANTTANAALPKAGGTMTGDIAMGDNVKLKAGASDDLQIYHDPATGSYIKDVGAGSLFIQSNNNGVIIEGSDGVNLLYADTLNDSLKLYHNNNQKLATTSTGVDVTGTVTASDISAVSSTNPRIRLFETDTTNKNTQIKNNGGVLEIATLNDAASGTTPRILIDHTTGDISFYEDTGTTAKFFWDASAESLGIGTTSPTYPLDISTSGTNLFNAYDGYGLFRVTTSGAGKVTTIGNQAGGGQLAFNTSGTERARIDSSGNLLVGATTLQGNGFTMYPNGSGGGVYCIYNRPNTTNNTTVFSFRNNGAAVGSVVYNNSGTSYNTSSDYRLKEDARPMVGSVERVKALNPINFAWKVDGSRVDGFLAHEAQAVVPEAVHGTKDAMKIEEYEVTPAVYEDIVIPAVLDDDGNEVEPERTESQLVTEAVMGEREVPDYQGIDQSKLVPLLTAALQEALERIEALEAQAAS
jgi:hypothetical protein